MPDIVFISRHTKFGVENAEKRMIRFVNNNKSYVITLC
jgi:hypothetical protein